MSHASRRPQGAEPHARLALSSRDAVLCDFDGTITMEDTGCATMAAFAPPEWWEVELAWRRGDISSMDCLRIQYGTVRLTEEAYRDFILAQPLDLGLRQLTETCRDAGADFRIVSDGLDLYIRWILEELGLSGLPVFANRGWFEGDRVQVAFPYEGPICKVCAHCKLVLIRRLQHRGKRVILIGDGYSDRCPAAHADVLFAKAALAEHCGRTGVRFLRFDSLADVVARLIGGPGDLTAEAAQG